MGMSSAGVFIKLEESNKYDLDKIATEFFGKFEMKSDKWGSGFDFRNYEHKIISQYDHGINIMDAGFVNEVLVNGNTGLITQIFDYFDKPMIIFSYMHYDSGDSFGFRYIENGWSKRSRFKKDGRLTIEEGTPLPEELEILNSELFYQGPLEDEFLCFYIDSSKKISNGYHFISSSLAAAVMRNRIGFDFNNDSIQSKSNYYTYKQKEAFKGKVNKKGFLSKLFSKRS